MSRYGPSIGRQGLLPRVGDEHLQERLIHASTALPPVGGMPPVVPKTDTPHGDELLHGVTDTWKQPRKSIEHRLVGYPISWMTEDEKNQRGIPVARR